MKFLTATVLSLSIFSVAIANDYEDAWAAIHKKNYKEAVLLLKKVTQNPATALDGYCTLLYLQTYLGKEQEIDGLVTSIMSNADKNSYIYSLWFNGAILGQYSKKQPYQLAFLNKVDQDNSINGTLKQASKYVRAMHYIFSNDDENAGKNWKQIGSLQEWQILGPF